MDWIEFLLRLFYVDIMVVRPAMIISKIPKMKQTSETRESKVLGTKDEP